MRLLVLALALALSGCIIVERPPRGAPPATKAKAQPPPPATPPPAPSNSPPPSPPPTMVQTPPPVTAAPGAKEVAIRRRVSDEFDSHSGEFRACYDSAGNFRRGRVTFKFTVAPSGEVVLITDEGSSFEDPTVVRCLTRTISAIRFTPWDGKAVDIVQPMEFTPGG